MASNLDIVVDGKSVDVANSFTYKGMMYSDVPNMAFAFGYTNASWTLKADLTSRYVCRLLNYMQRHRYDVCCPTNDDADLAPQALLDFSSGYVQRSPDELPKQGTKAPWKLYQNYLLDLLALGFGSLRDKAMKFRRVSPNLATPNRKLSVSDLSVSDLSVSDPPDAKQTISELAVPDLKKRGETHD